MTGKRQLACAVLGCLAGAGLALFAVTRTWIAEAVSRPAPLPSIRTARTGGDLLAWLPALAATGLAAAGALLATRGAARRAVGVLLLLVGLGIAGGAGYAAAAHDGVRLAWPVLSVLGGLAVATAGAAAATRGRSWPAMGARYERPAARSGERPVPTRAWDALDRGEDPTV